MELINEAIIFATNAHNGMKRKKTDIPYILHPLEAAVIVGTMTTDQEVIAAAVLHDVVEDTKVSIDEIENIFGERVKKLVSSETENKRHDVPSHLSWRIRKEETLEILKNADDIGVLMVWIGDKLANIRSLYHELQIEGEKTWEKFNQKDVKQHEWYYRNVVKFTERLNHTYAWQEFKTLVDKVFGKEA